APSVLGQAAGSCVLEEELDGLGGVLLVRPDHAARPALDPAGAVETGNRLPILAEHSPVGVRDRAGAFGERHPREADAAVADASEDDPARNDVVLVGDDGADAAAPVRLEPVVSELDSLDPLVAEDRDRRRTEAQPHVLRLPRGRTRRELS